MPRNIDITAIRNGDSFPLKLMWSGHEYFVMGMSIKKGVWRPWQDLAFGCFEEFKKYMNDKGYFVKEKGCHAEKNNNC